MPGASPLDLEPLLEAFPKWREFVRSERSDTGEYFVLHLPAPPDSHVDHGLLVHTDNQEVTVSFDYLPRPL